MTNLTHRTRRWPKVVMAVTVLIELVLGIGVAALQNADSATPVSVDAALDDFRNQQRAASEEATTATEPSTGEVDPTDPGAGAGTTNTTADQSASRTATPAAETPGTTPSGPIRPAPGVYTYLTSGWEEISPPRGSHPYPAETTITVMDEGNVQRARWNALEERWDEWTTTSTAAGEEWLTLTAYHEFFGQKDTRSFQCQPGSLYIPSDRTPGTTFEMHCGDADLHSSCQGQVIGLETLDVAGAPVEALRLRMDTTMEGNVRGHMGRDYWVLPSSGLLLREVLKTDTDGDGPGGVTLNYKEEVELVLKSLQPAQ